MAASVASDAPPVDWRRLHPVTVLRELLGLAWNLGFALLVFGDVDLSDLGFELVAGGAVLAVAIGRYLSTRYAVTEDAFLYRRGIVVRRRVTVPRNRVQNVSNGADVIGRLFGLRTVTVASAGSEGEVKLALLDAGEAGSLVAELLRRAAGATDGGAVSPVPGAAAGGPGERATLDASVPGTIPSPGPGAGPGAAGAGASRLLYRARTGDLVRFALTGPVPVLVLVAGLVATGALLAGRGPLAAVATVAPMLIAAASVLDLVGFRLEATEDRLVVRHGLVATRERWARRERIQLLGVDRPLVRGAFGYETVSVATADASVVADDALRLAAPLVARGGWRSLASQIVDGAPATAGADGAGGAGEADGAGGAGGVDSLGRVAVDEAHLQPVSRLAVRRRTVRWSLVTMLLVGPPVVVVGAVLDGVAAAVMVGAVAGGAALVVLGAWVVARRSWRLDGYALDDGHLLVRRGTLGSQLWLVRRAKVQTVGLRSSPLQRRLGLVTLTVDTAAPRNGAAVLADLPLAAAEALAAELVDHAARVHLSDGV